jgi:hypothetical protein
VTQQESKKLELHRQRAADLFASLLLLELGVRIRADVPAQQPAAGELPAPGQFTNPTN